MIDGAQFMAETQTEKEFGDNVEKFAKARGWLVHRDPTWRPTCTNAGYPDLTMLRDRVLIFAELKREKGGRLTPDQVEWLGEIERIGTPVRAYVWRPSDWNQIEKVLT